MRNLLFLVVGFLPVMSFGYGNILRLPQEITSSTINWELGEPKYLLNSMSYKSWIKDFGVIDGKLSKKLDYQGHGIRYWLADLTGDGRSEVIVQEAVWSASGYALAIFSYHGGVWKKIAQHRGGFILNRSETNSSYKLTLIEKSGADYGLFEYQYRDGSYNLMKSISPFRDISFEQFWFYNMTRVEYCQSPIRNPLGRSTFCR